MSKLLKEQYKTYEGARKRATFENGVAPSEYRNGLKSRLYHYMVVKDDYHDLYRVQRDNGRTE